MLKLFLAHRLTAPPCAISPFLTPYGAKKKYTKIDNLTPLGVEFVKCAKNNLVKICFLAPVSVG